MTSEKAPKSSGQKAKEDKLIEPILIIGTIPCMNNLLRSVWEIIKGPAAKLASFSGGEYETYDVFKAVWFGGSFLYVAYMCDSKEDSEFAALSADNANLIIAKYVTMKREKDFVGYTVVRLDDNGAHVWQAHISEPYQGTDVFEICVEFIIQQMATIGVKRVTFTSIRHGWGPKIKSIKFKEGMTNFYRDIVPVPIEENTDHITV